MFDLNKSNLRTIEEKDLELILSWRNSSRVRSQMYNDSEIDPANHRKWFSAISKDPNRAFWIFEYAGVPMGTVQFSGLSSQAATWGFYLGLEDTPKGMGSWMCSLALDRIFDRFPEVEWITGEVLKFNEGSIRFHKKLGFQEVGQKTHYMESRQKEVEVLIYRLERSVWRDGAQDRLASLPR